MNSTNVSDRPQYFKSVKGSSFEWINIDTASADSVNALVQVHPFHPLDIEDCLSKTQLTKIDEYKDYLFIILHNGPSPSGDLIQRFCSYSLHQPASW